MRDYIHSYLIMLVHNNMYTQRATNYIVHALEDDSLGIKSDRRDFLAKPPKQGTEISKVMSKSFSFKILNMWLYKR